jgi:hypothetical protein
MDQAIWKYQFEINDELQVKEMPLLSRCVHVASQDDVLCMWAIVEPKYKLVKKYFRVHGTGFVYDIEDGDEYVGTAHMPPFVWHLFEIKK